MVKPVQIMLGSDNGAEFQFARMDNLQIFGNLEIKMQGKINGSTFQICQRIRVGASAKQCRYLGMFGQERIETCRNYFGHHAVRAGNGNGCAALRKRLDPIRGMFSVGKDAFRICGQNPAGGCELDTFAGTFEECRRRVPAPYS